MTQRRFAKLSSNCRRRAWSIASAIDWDRIKTEPQAVCDVRQSEPVQRCGRLRPDPLELGQRWPEIPRLVVEGRSQTDWLARLPLDLSHLKNLHKMANTPDPRDFYKVTRGMLMPSLGREGFGRVAVKSLINGIPVLSSDRGALPEVLSEAGFVFDIPEAYTPETTRVPAPTEVGPWVETIIRLWDDPEFYEGQQKAALAAAEAFRYEEMLARHDRFFRGLI